MLRKRANHSVRPMSSVIGSSPSLQYSDAPKMSRSWFSVSLEKLWVWKLKESGSAPTRVVSRISLCSISVSRAMSSSSEVAHALSTMKG